MRTMLAANNPKFSNPFCWAASARCILANVAAGTLSLIFARQERGLYMYQIMNTTLARLLKSERGRVVLYVLGVIPLNTAARRLDLADGVEVREDGDQVGRRDGVECVV